MFLANVNVGSGPNTGDGDSLRNAFIIVNDNTNITQTTVNGIAANVVINADAIITANTAMKAYVDSQLDIISGSSIEVDSNIANLIANAGAQSDSITSLIANAAVQSVAIATLGTDISNANVLMTGYVDSFVTSLTANAAIQSVAIADLDLTKADLAGASFTGDVSITGNLNVLGTQTIFSTNNASFNDAMLYLADNNAADLLDIGVVSSFTGATYQHTGIVRDATDGVWKLFANVATEPGLTVDFTDATYSDLHIGNLTATNVSGTLTTAAQPNITSVGSLTNLTVTGNISGKTNGYDIGYKDAPQIASGNVTMPADVGGKHYFSTTAAEETITIPTNANVALNLGTTISVVSRGTGNVILQGQTGVNLYVPGNATAVSSKTLGSYGMATLIKVESNGWIISGIQLSDTIIIISLRKVWAWGVNNYGQLGLGDVDSRSSPVQVGALTNWETISIYNQAIAINTDGSLWSWGLNLKGQLGLGDTGVGTNRSSPVQVGALTDWAALSAGREHSLAIKTDGTLWSWGDNYNGQLGLGDIIGRSSPVQVGALTNWSKISAGDYQTLAIKTDGTLWACGYNTDGQLALGDIVHRSSPVQVGALTDWAKVSAGGWHVAAIKSDGTLWSWGYNSNGQLGLGDDIPRSSPVQVGALTDWSQISSGRTHFAAIKTDGTLWTCGYNPYGQLGLGDIVQRSSPVQVGALTDWSKVVCGDYFISAIKTDGTLWTWGDNQAGALGLGDIVHRSSPVQVGALTNWANIACGYRFMTSISSNT